MKVAIVGAGPSGMACALELEKHGILPVLFEKRHRPGELFDHCAAVLQLFTRPYDPLGHLNKKFGIDIRPIGPIKHIIMKSPQKQVAVNGNLGYFVMRGHDPASVESQLYSRIKSKLVTNTQVDYLELSRRFDFVVVADGGYNSSRTEGIWSLIYPTKLIGGVVLGKFDMTRMHMWVDTRYSLTGYAYLCPIEPKRAFLGLIVTERTPEKARILWEKFWEMEKLPYDLVNEILIEHNAGFIYPHQVGNMLFVGIAGGFQEPFLGFGLASSVKSGVLAARSIATGRNYEDLLFQLKEDMLHSLLLRDMFNDVNNDHLNLLMKSINIPGIKQFVYNSNVDMVRLGSAAVAQVKKLTGLFKRP